MPSYFYFFDHGYPAAEALGYHAFHASELPYIFGHVGKGAGLGVNWPLPEGPKENALSDAMISYWTSFARTAFPRRRDNRTGRPMRPTRVTCISRRHRNPRPI